MSVVSDKLLGILPKGTAILEDREEGCRTKANSMWFYTFI